MKVLGVGSVSFTPHFKGDEVSKEDKSSIKFDNGECTGLYSQDEIKKIIGRLGTTNNYTNMSAFRVYMNKDNTLTIHNCSLTNDDIVISADGSARHVGSWHNKEIAPKGTCTDIFEDAKKRVENTRK